MQQVVGGRKVRPREVSRRKALSLEIPGGEESIVSQHVLEASGCSLLMYVTCM